MNKPTPHFFYLQIKKYKSHSLHLDSTSGIMGNYSKFGLVVLIDGAVGEDHGYQNLFGELLYIPPLPFFPPPFQYVPALSLMVRVNFGEIVIFS